MDEVTNEETPQEIPGEPQYVVAYVKENGGPVFFIADEAGRRVSVQQWSEKSTADYALEHGLYTTR